MRFSDMMGSGADNPSEPVAASEPVESEAGAPPGADIAVAIEPVTSIDPVTAIEPAAFEAAALEPTAAVKSWVPERTLTTSVEYGPLSDDLLPHRR